MRDPLGGAYTRYHPYSCDLCDKSFLHLNHLTAHKMFHIGEKQYHCKLCQKSFCSNSDLLLHNKAAAHLNMLLLSNNKVPTSTSSSFVDCGEANIKLEIKEEETVDEDPLSINIIEADNFEEESVKQEKEEEGKDKDFLQCLQNSDQKRINEIDIVEHTIEI